MDPSLLSMRRAHEEFVSENNELSTKPNGDETEKNVNYFGGQDLPRHFGGFSRTSRNQPPFVNKDPSVSPLEGLTFRGWGGAPISDVDDNNNNKRKEVVDDGTGELELKLPTGTGGANAGKSAQRAEDRTMRLKKATEQELETLVASIVQANETNYWEKNNDVLRKVDGSGSTCFHWMVRKGASIQIIQEALKNFGEASAAMNKDQDMPIKLALSHREPDLEVIKALVCSDRTCLESRYEIVHAAVSSKVHPTIVQYLVGSCPESEFGRKVNLLDYIADVKNSHTISDELILSVLKKNPEDAFSIALGENKSYQDLAAYRLLAGWRGEQDCMQHRAFLHLYTFTLKRSTHKTVAHLLALLCLAFRAIHDDAPAKVTQLLDLLHALPDFDPVASQILHLAAKHCRQLACFEIVYQRFPQCHNDILVTVDETKQRGPFGEKDPFEVKFRSPLQTFVAAVDKWEPAVDSEQDLIGIVHLLLPEQVVAAAEAAPFIGDRSNKVEYKDAGRMLKELLESKTCDPSVCQRLRLRDREEMLQTAYTQILKDFPHLTPARSAFFSRYNTAPPPVVPPVKEPVFLDLARIALSPAELACGVRYGSCALHLALQFSLPDTLIAYLLRASPGCCELSTRTLDMALACVPPLSIGVIDRVVKLVPQYVCQFGVKDTPLHLALKHGAPLEVVQLLFDAWPEAAREKNGDDELPLLYALLSPKYNVFLPELMDLCAKKLTAKNCNILLKAIKLGLQDVSTLQILLAEFPALAFVVCNGEGALLNAVSAKVPISTIQFLLTLEPEDDEAEPMLCVQNYKDELPLEITFQDKTTPLELTRLLLPPYFNELRGRCLTDKYTSSFDKPLAPYTLRKAILACVPMAVLDLLVEAAPTVFQQPSTAGMLPLHYIFEEEGVFTKELFEYVFAAFPGAAQLEDTQLKRLPLHYAAKIPTQGAVTSLIAANPGACQARDSDDLLPLHVALRYACPESEADLMAIIDAFPEACVMPSDSAAFTSKDPVLFVLGAERLCPMVCVEKILSLVPPVLDIALLKHCAKIDVEGGGGRLLRAVVRRRLQCDVPTGSIWHDILSSSFDAVTAEVKANMVGEILSESPHLVQRLCHGRDINGREAINIVDRPVREVMLLHTLFCGRFGLSKGPVVHRSATSVVVQALDHAPAEDWQADFQRTCEQEGAPAGQLPFTGFFQVGLRLDLFAYEHPDLTVKNAKVALFDAASKRWLNGYVKAITASAAKELDPKVTIVLSSADGGAAQERVVSVSVLRGPEIVDIAALFASIDHGKKGYLSEDEFLQVCKERLGDTRRVVLKFMRNQDQYQRELDYRNQDAGVKSCVLGLLRAPDADLLAANLQTLMVGEHSLSEYKFCLVMPEADRNLDSIRRFEKPDKEVIRRYFRDIARTLGDLHENNIMHGDIKLLNAVRLKQQVQLIDLDAASSIGSGFAGAKFSSGVLPPEMFAELTSTEREQYMSYWKKNIPDMDSGTFRKLLPVDIGQGKYIVVRTYHTGADGNPVHADEEGTPVGDVALPYTLVPASARVDAWSFGVMLFSMFARCPLLLVSDEDDLVPIMLPSAPPPGTACGHKKVDMQPMQIAKEWTKEAIFDQLQVVEDNAARELLGQLLDPNPATRLHSMRAVLKHRFFNADSSSEELVLKELAKMSADVKGVAGAVDGLSTKTDTTHHMLHEAQTTLNSVHAGVVRLETLSVDMCARLESTRNALLKALIEANDVVVPSCFVIVNQKLQSLTAEATCVEPSELTSVEVVEKRLSDAQRWVGKISSFFDAVSNPSALIEIAQQKMVDMFAGETLYLYLVDEVTMLPYVPRGDEYDAYPIPITTTAECAAQLVPLLKISMTAISIVNTASGLARCLGYPTPYVPDSVTGALKKSIHQLDDKTSIAEFDKLQSLALQSASGNDTKSALTAGSGNGDPNTVRGQALRQLEALIAMHDPAKTLCGLRRVIPPGGDGSVVWTTEEGLEQLVQGSVRGLSVEIGCQTEVTHGEQEAGFPSDIYAVATTASPSKHVPISISSHPASSAKARGASAKSPATSTATTSSVSSSASPKHASGKFSSTTDVDQSSDQDETYEESEEDDDLSLGLEGRPSVHAETYQQMKDLRTQSTSGDSSAVAVLEDPSVVLRFEKGIFHMDVCINVIFQAATLVFGADQHNIARPRSMFNKFSFFGSKVNLSRELSAQAGGSKMVHGALVMQVMRKGMSTTGECLFYMFRLREWESLLKMETGLHTLNRSRKN